MTRASPVEIKRKRGTLRKDRTPGDLVPVEHAPLDVPAPASLKGTGKAAWEKMLLHASWIANSDLFSLQVYCELLDRRERLLVKFELEDETLYTSTQYAYNHPLLKAIDTVETQLARWASLLGVTPSDRSRLGVAEVVQASTLDKLAARRAERDVVRQRARATRETQAAMAETEELAAD